MVVAGNVLVRVKLSTTGASHDIKLLETATIKDLFLVVDWYLIEKTPALVEVPHYSLKTISFPGEAPKIFSRDADDSDTAGSIMGAKGMSLRSVELDV